MNNQSNDVKQTVALASTYWSHKRSDFPILIFKSIVPTLVNGTKEKNSAVRVYSEQALIAMLKLKEADSAVYQKCLKTLDTGAAEALQDSVARLKKTIAKCDLKDEEFDETMLS
jgi:hypothetical protein